MTVSIIVAIAENNAIGKDNKLLWSLPRDLKHFKEITSGHTVIMGRKTYDSMGKSLPNRRNIIITRQEDMLIIGVEVVNTLEHALALCADEEEVFIIGGAQIYEQALQLTDKIYLTVVHESYEADTVFPELDPERWTVLSSELHLPDEKNNVAFTFQTLQSK